VCGIHDIVTDSFAKIPATSRPVPSHPIPSHPIPSIHSFIHSFIQYKVFFCTSYFISLMPPSSDVLALSTTSFRHNTWEAASACGQMSLIARLLAIPVMPSMLKALHSDCPAKPRLPTSTGRFQFCHPCCRHSSTNAWYLAFFLSCAFSILSSHGIVNSRRTICLIIPNSSKISGRSFVLATSAGNFSFFKSARNSQCVAVVGSWLVWALSALGNSFFVPYLDLPQFRSGSCHVATYIFRPSMLFCTKTGYAQDLLPQSLQLGSSLRFHVSRLVGVDSTSYTERSRNPILCWSILIMSFHDTLLAWTPSHFSQLPCFFVDTVVACLPLLMTWLPAEPSFSSLKALQLSSLLLWHIPTIACPW